MSEIILGLYPQPEDPKPFLLADINNNFVAKIMPEDFWQYGPDAMKSTDDLNEAIEGEA